MNKNRNQNNSTTPMVIGTVQDDNGKNQDPKKKVDAAVEMIDWDEQDANNQQAAKAKLLMMRNLVMES